MADIQKRGPYQWLRIQRIRAPLQNEDFPYKNRGRSLGLDGGIRNGPWCVRLPEGSREHDFVRGPGPA